MNLSDQRPLAFKQGVADPLCSLKGHLYSRGKRGREVGGCMLRGTRITFRRAGTRETVVDPVANTDLSRYAYREME